MAINGFRDLRVWQSAMNLVETIYKLSNQFPSNEIYGLTNQMRRAAVSVASNIAEGHAREHTREYLNHVSIAHGSLAELDTQVEISERLGYCEPSQAAEVLRLIVALRQQLYALRNALQRHLSSSAQKS